MYNDNLNIYHVARAAWWLYFKSFSLSSDGNYLFFQLFYTKYYKINQNYVLRYLLRVLLDILYVNQSIQLCLTHFLIVLNWPTSKLSNLIKKFTSYKKFPPQENIFKSRKQKRGRSKKLFTCIHKISNQNFIYVIPLACSISHNDLINYNFSLIICSNGDCLFSTVHMKSMLVNCARITKLP